MTRLWKVFIMGEGLIFESDSMSYLMYYLKEEKGWRFPREAEVDILLSGTTECEVIDKDGHVISIKIEEHNTKTSK